MANSTKKIVRQLERIAAPYLEEAEALFREKARLTRTDAGKWQELVYCILAGTQFPVRKLKPLYTKLVTEHLELISIYAMTTSSGRTKLTAFLKRNGYRYYNQKTATVSNAAAYFLETFNGHISEFLFSSTEVEVLRKILVESINGVGFKIASHWLRNVGIEVCTVDLHLRRLFYHLGATEDLCDGDLDREVFVSLEKIFHKLAHVTKKPVGVIQYSIWRYTVERCAEFKCSTCVLKKQCLRGRSVQPKPEQMFLL